MVNRSFVQMEKRTLRKQSLLNYRELREPDGPGLGYADDRVAEADGAGR